MAEAEEKAHNLLAEQERRRFELKQAMERSRQDQMDKRHREKVQTKKEEKEFTEFWKIRNEELEIAMKQEQEEERMRQVELKGYLKH